MSTYKLHYFNIEGRAGTIRFLFALADQAYEDCRYTFASFKELQPNTPFGQIPILEVDGVKIAQSRAIGRFLARRFNYAGKTDVEQAQADMIVDHIEDAFDKIVGFVRASDEKEKEEKKKKLEEEQLPDDLCKLEKLLVSNGGGDGYFVGDSLTWADLAFTHFATYPERLKIGVDFKKFPKLTSLAQRVEALPRIKKWIQERPEGKLE